jgi:hypothetical protein
VRQPFEAEALSIRTNRLDITGVLRDNPAHFRGIPVVSIWAPPAQRVANGDAKLKGENSDA